MIVDEPEESEEQCVVDEHEESKKLYVVDEPEESEEQCEIEENNLDKLIIFNYTYNYEDFLILYYTNIEFTSTNEIESIKNISMVPIFGSELEGLNSSSYPLITSPIKLCVGTQFKSWDIAEYYLKEYGRQIDLAGKYKAKKVKPIGQQRNKGSKKTNCKWYVNMSNPE
ncbi:8210_t:CDS:2, partial [Racocetra fulgida]